MHVKRSRLAAMLVSITLIGSILTTPAALAEGLGETSEDTLTKCNQYFLDHGTLHPLHPEFPGPMGYYYCANQAVVEGYEWVVDHTDLSTAPRIAQIRADMLADGVDAIVEVVNAVTSSITEGDLDLGLKFGFVPSPKSCLDQPSYCTNINNHLEVTASPASTAMVQSSSGEIAYNMYISNRVLQSPRSYDAEANVRFNIFSESDAAEDAKSDNTQQRKGLHATFDYYAISQVGTATPQSGCNYGYCAEVHALEVGVKDTTEDVVVAEYSPEGVSPYGSAGTTTVSASVDIGGTKVGVSNSWERPRGESGAGVSQGFAYYEGIWRDLDGGSRTAKGLRTASLWEAPKGTAPWWRFHTILWYDGPCYRTNNCA